MRRLSLLFVLTVGVMLMLPTAAPAHTDLDSTVPAADSTVTDPPIEVVLTFSAALQPGSEPAVRVIDPAGDDLVSAPPTLDGATVTVPLNLAVAAGEHRVDWSITAADGDDQTGSFTFSFQPAPAPTATPTPTPAPEPTAEPAVEPTEPAPVVATEQATPTPAATLVPADPTASSTTTRALVVVAAFFAVFGVGAVMLTRAKRNEA